MADTPESVVISARGHVEMCEWLIARHRERIEKGEALPDVQTVERWIAAEEIRLSEWRRTLERAISESRVALPLA